MSPCPSPWKQGGLATFSDTLAAASGACELCSILTGAPVGGGLPTELLCEALDLQVKTRARGTSISQGSGGTSWGVASCVQALWLKMESGWAARPLDRLPGQFFGKTGVSLPAFPSSACLPSWSAAAVRYLFQVYSVGTHIWWVCTHVSTLGSDDNKPVTICPYGKGRYEHGAVPVFLVSAGSLPLPRRPHCSATGLFSGSVCSCSGHWVLDSTRK